MILIMQANGFKHTYHLGSTFCKISSSCFCQECNMAVRYCGYFVPKIPAAYKAALTAPALPIAMVATGIPPGICTMDNKESMPFNADSMGTPITGNTVFAAITPGKCAAP